MNKSLSIGRFRRQGRLATTVTLAAIALAAAACGGGSAATRTPRAATNSVGSPQDLTFGFRVYNTTFHEAKFAGIWQGGCPITKPDDNTPLHPNGSYLDFELTYKVFTTTWCNLYFDVLDSNGNKTAQFAFNVGINGDISGGHPYVQYAAGNGRDTTPGWTAGFLAQTPSPTSPNFSAITMFAPLSGNPQTWMHDLAPNIWNRKLSQIVIPASHDSTTYSLQGPGDDLWHTQSHDLKAQLDDGMREFDIRVTDHLSRDGNFYAHHGSGSFDGVSNWLTLARIFSDIGDWATAPGHGQEIIMLHVQVDLLGAGDTNYPTSACQAFGQRLGAALVTPNVLQAGFHTTDPGQVTPGQLWSLSDPNGYARVIMDNNQCMGDAVSSAGQWPSAPAITGGLFDGYYADQCAYSGFSAPGNQWMGIHDAVLAAVKTRATGAGDTPNKLGPPKVGGLYNLGIMGTPELGCLYTPNNMMPDERGVLNALLQQWQADAATQVNLNIISADFVQDTDLMKDVLAMDESFPVQLPPGAGFSTLNLEPVGLVVQPPDPAHPERVKVGSTVHFGVEAGYVQPGYLLQAPGWRVTFDASGAGGYFPGGGSEAAETTGAGGIALSPALTYTGAGGGHEMVVGGAYHSLHWTFDAVP